jgi:DedD protein
MAENQDVNMLKRRGRRRLVGAIALVVAAVVVLPMVFDSEPKGSAPPVSVRIPGEDETGFTPKVTPKSPPVQGQKPAEKPAAKAAEVVPEKAPEAAPEKAAAVVPVEQAAPAPQAQPEKPAPKIEIAVTKGSEKPAAKVRSDAEQKRAEAALAGEQFMVPAGAYADPAGVIEKLKEAKIPYYTEPIATKQGTVTRVRAGPFASREAADKAMQQLKGLGLKPGNVASKT